MSYCVLFAAVKILDLLFGIELQDSDYVLMKGWAYSQTRVVYTLLGNWQAPVLLLPLSLQMVEVAEFGCELLCRM